MNEIKLLIVEDNESDKEAWEINIEEFNRSIEKEGLETVFEFGKSFEEANKRISNDFDAVIIDLRLEGDDKSSLETGGGRLIDEKVDILRLPTFVYTATPALIDEIEKKETVFFKKYVKDQKRMSHILDEIKRIYDTGITRILGGRGKIEELLNTIFWNHLSLSLDYWMKPHVDIDPEKVLLRYIAAHFSEYLAISQEGNIDKFSPPEFYITPPIGKNFYTGDILKGSPKNRKDEVQSIKYYIIINPACDMVMREATKDNKKILCRNSKKIVLASLIRCDEVEELKGITKDSGIDKKEKFKSYMRNNKGRYHFLPKYREIEAMFIDFESIDSIDPFLVERDFERIATISPVILRNIIARFSQYYSRQGQPDLNVDNHLEEILPD